MTNKEIFKQIEKILVSVSHFKQFILQTAGYHSVGQHHTDDYDEINRSNFFNITSIEDEIKILLQRIQEKEHED